MQYAYSPNKYVPFTASPIPADIYNKTLQAQILAAERERIRAEFFATYDVMTGVRIAATLGGFFGLMVFLIVWKSRSSSNETMKVLKVFLKTIVNCHLFKNERFRIQKWPL